MLLALCFNTFSYGQKLKDKKISVKYVSIPSMKLPAEYDTYSTRVYGNAIGTGRVDAAGLAKSIKMNNFKQLDETDGYAGHLRVLIYAGNVNTGKASRKSKTTSRKDKKGKVTTTTSYWYEVPYSVSCSYKVVDPTGNALISGNHPVRSTLRFKKGYTGSQAYKNYKNQISNSIRSAASGAASNVVKLAQKGINSKLDFCYSRASPELFYLKKYESAADFQKHFEDTKTIFAKATATTSAEELKEQLKPAMKFWVEQGDFEPKGDKKLMRVYKAAYYNLALVHYYLDNLDAAKMYADLVIKSEGKDKDAKNLLKQIETTKKRMALHDIHTLHYKRDLSKAVGLANVKEVEESKEDKAVVETISMEGSILLKEQQIKGQVFQEKEAKEMLFGANGNTWFVVEKGEESTEYEFTTEEITAFKIGGRSFIKMPFSPCAKGKTAAATHIMEELYVSEKIKLYQYHPTSGALGDEKSEFAFQKTNSESPISLLDTQFLLLNKGLANYFSDCEDLKTMCSEGAIKMEKDDLVKAARIYSELCESSEDIAKK